MTANLGAEAGSRLVVAQASSGNYFDVLGVRTRVGRLFGPNDDYRGGTPVVVLSDELWRSHFGGDPSIVGRTVRLNRTQFTVIGVTRTCCSRGRVRGNGRSGFVSRSVPVGVGSSLSCSARV